MYYSKYAPRRYVILGMMFLLALIILIRLFYLQVIDDSYKLSAESNVLRAIKIYPDRGYIYDRYGNLLVSNQPAYDLMTIPKEVKELDTLEFCKDLGLSLEELKQCFVKMKESRGYSRFRPSVLVKELSKETYASLQEKLYKYPGFYVQQRTLRDYKYPVGANVVGYISQVPRSIVKADPYYESGDNIGISGIEKAYEEQLRGQKGVRYVVRDVHNREKGSFADGRYDTLPQSGQDIITTISADLQAFGEQLMQNKVGSIVAIEPSTGEILCLVTSPSYNPKLLIGRERAVNYPKLQEDSLKPMFDRALLAEYPPGSTFKLLNALIGLQEGVLRPYTRYACQEGFRWGSLKVGCHHHPSPVDLRQGIATSCNAYFCYTYKSILEKHPSAELGYTIWRDYIGSFGLGDFLNNDLPTGRRGLLPKSTYYDNIYGRGSWKAVTNISLAIGQGELLATPIQMANMTAAIANKGEFFTPHIVKSVGGNENFNDRFKVPKKTLIDSVHFDVVIDGMQRVFEDPGGTAYWFRLPNLTQCGKTGTAQNTKGEDHSAFIAFAPRENPQIAIAVYVENAGWGSSYAAPIASLMMEKYVTGEITRDYLVKRMVEADLIHKEEKDGQ